MFQNIQAELEDNTKEETEKGVNILTNIISGKYIILYILTFMLSCINLGQGVSPFSLAMVAAIGANEIPIAISLVVGLAGNIVGAGVGSILTYIVTLLVFFLSFFAKEPKYNNISRNEKIRYGARIFWASLIVNVAKVYISGFLWYDLFVAITMSVLVYVLYKIFTNSITVITEFNQTRAFTIEEAMGASVLLAVAVCVLGNFSILGFSIRNIIAIFIVLVLGWKNGMLVGTTAGVTIGVTLGIITGNDPVAIAAYAMSGLIAGILNKFGKIGVIVGFILGDIILTYLSNGGIQNLIVFKEILIAGIGLLAVPKSVNLNIESILGDKKLLPVGANRGLNKSKETIEKLKDMSNAVKDIAENYGVINKKEKKDESKLKNKQIFITELLNYTENMEDNILYDNMSDVEGKIVDDIFNKLIDKQFIKEKDLLKIFAQNNNYVVGFDDEEKIVNRDVEKMTQAINSAYRISKMNFIWTSRLEEEKENTKTKLVGVSKAISDMAKEIQKDEEAKELYEEEINRISILLKQKEILVQDISIKKEENEKYRVQIFIEETDKNNTTDILCNIISKSLNEKVVLIESANLFEEKCEKYVFVSDDKFIIEIGQAIEIKDGMSVSGDSVIQTKLKDGKYLFVISDGMGSGPEARKSSQIVTKMLQRLLNSGFNKEISIDLINSNLLDIGEDVFATLDIAIVDLYKGTMEFIKSGASPTYIKNKRRTQLIKSTALPTGIIQNINQEIFDKDIENGDIIVMCSDGIIDSNVEYKNKELWLKYLLEDMESNVPQKMADIILNEAVDNNYGKIKDDMSVIVFKLLRK